MKKGVKPTIQNSKPMNLSQVNRGNSSFEIKREKIGLDIFENRLFFSYEPKLNSFSWDDKT
jgi:hypothetical protein|tara:strand:+ start:102 stop:284 length:183 start_codon:yes stop_codon:yes gene_type:complete